MTLTPDGLPSKTAADPPDEPNPGRGSQAGGNRRPAQMPSGVTPEVGLFDRFADRAAAFSSQAWFFTLCLLTVVVWAPSYFAIGDLNTWQLIINTLTTIITFLLVALLQNTQSRANKATQAKLNAIADGLADLMEAQSDTSPELVQDLLELRAAVGLEDRESA